MQKTPVHESGRIVTAGTAWTIVLLLSLAYALSFVDRQLPSLLVGPIRAELAINDVQFSLLQGFAFALTYAVVGIPLGALSDRIGPRPIIVGGVLVWSLATAACAFARSFPELFVSRTFVGVGEAALVPASYALMAALFQPRMYARGMSVFMSGSTMGAGLAVLFGSMALTFATRIDSQYATLSGWLPAWRATFLIVGLPGIPLAIVLGLVLGDRKWLRPPPELERDGGWTNLWRKRQVLIPMFAGFSLFSLAVYGTLGWLPEAFRRTYHWLPQRYGVIVGPIQIAASVAGAIAAGILIDRAQTRGHRDAAVRLATFAAFLLVPVLLLATLVRSPTTSLVLLAPAWALMGSLLPAPGVAIQRIVPPHSVALASGVFVFCANLLGLGCGPTAVALATKYLFASNQGLFLAIGIVGGASLTLSGILLHLARVRLLRSSS